MVVEDKHIEKSVEDKEADQWILEKMRSNWFIHKGINFIWNVYLIYSLVKEWDYELLRHTFNKELNVGLLEGSLIQNPLYLPQSNGKLSYIDTLGGKWIGYDFKRREEFRNPERQIQEGKPFTFLLDEIKKNPKERHTPTDLLDIFDAAHICQLDTLGINQLIKYELVEPTTYREGFKKVGFYEKFARNLDILGIAEKTVYQVTPKGNGLISLEDDGGDMKEMPKPQPELQPGFSYAKALPKPL